MTNKRNFRQLYPVSDTEAADTSPNSKRPKRSNNKNSKSQPCDFSEILSKLSSIESSVKSVEEKVNEVVTSNEEVKKSIAELKKEVETKTSNHEVRISTIEELSINLQASVNQIKTTNEGIYNEMNKINLVISGLPDSDEESNGDLVKTVRKLIHDITKNDMQVDVTSRLGKYRPNSTRAVKVRFLTMLERNCVYFHRSSLKHPYYINEDLSPETRKDLALLRQKKKEILTSDKHATVTIDQRKKTLVHGPTKISVNQGIVHSDTSRPSNSMDVDFQPPQPPQVIT